MEQTKRWKWIKLDDNRDAKFNSIDLHITGKFCIADNETKTLFYLKAINDSKTNKPKNIYIPKKLQTVDFICWAISTSPSIIKFLPLELLTPETIKYAIGVIKGYSFNEYDRFFYYIPIEKCCEAIRKYPDIFEQIPNKYLKAKYVEAYASTSNPKYELISPRFRTRELFRTIFFNNDTAGRIRLIKLTKGERWNKYTYHYFDASFITKDIAEEVLKISQDLKGYLPVRLFQKDKEDEVSVVEQTNSSQVPKTEKVLTNAEKNTSREQTCNNLPSCNKIELYDILGFFNNQIIRNILQASSIYTLTQFLAATSNPEFITWFGTSPMVIKDIYATIKLLRCKYLNEDPLIEFNDSMTIDEFIRNFGFSIEIEQALALIPKPSNFITMISMMSLEERIAYFKEMTNLSDKSINEIVYRTQIIIDYNNKKKIYNKSSVRDLLDRYNELNFTFDRLDGIKETLSNADNKSRGKI